jgi:serine/threonine protein kinase
MSEDLKQVGEYQVLEVLGRGYMCAVYRALDPRLGREVVIKLFTQCFAGKPEMIAQFHEELNKVRRLIHPNIASVEEVGEFNGIPYIVMEHIEGQSLDQIIRSGDRPSRAKSLAIIKDVCSALAYAKKNNVIHGDVRPAHVFIQPDGTPKLLDFAILQLQRMACDDDLESLASYLLVRGPEERASSYQGSDIYSTGIVLFQLVTGELPSKKQVALLLSRLMLSYLPHNETASLPPFQKKHSAPSDLGDFSPTLQSILHRSLNNDPRSCYSNADEMAFDLGALIERLDRD